MEKIDNEFKKALISIEKRKYNEAIESLQYVLKECPGHLGAVYNLARIYVSFRMFSDASRLIQKAINIAPEDEDVLYLAGLYCYYTNDFEQALIILRKCININSNSYYSWLLSGDVFLSLGLLENAHNCFSKCILIEPHNCLGYSKLGFVYAAVEKLDQALSTYKKAVELSTEFRDFYLEYSNVVMRMGKWKEAFALYEWRMSNTIWKENYIIYEKYPTWKGEIFSGETLLVYDDQLGCGDVIQFARYLPLVKNRGGEVILAVRSSLYMLMNDIEGIDKVVEQLPNVQAVDSFDKCIPIMSLGLIFGTSEKTIPKRFPYIKIAKEKKVFWEQFFPENDKLKIGLCWGTSAAFPDLANLSNRACYLKVFEPVFSLPFVQAYSLQAGKAATQVQEFPQIVNLMDKANDFLDTAAIIEKLDLIITVDTSILHLAGALNKKVWAVMTAYSPLAFFWNDHMCSESPWYPSMKLFKQEKWGEWDSVIKEVIISLNDLKK